MTREFNLNMLSVLNHHLLADFDESLFTHVAIWSEEHSRIEMRLRATRAMHVTLKRLDAGVDFEEDEELRTEISIKFERASVEAEFAAAGIEVRSWWTGRDERGRGTHDDYALVLGVRVQCTARPVTNRGDAVARPKNSRREPPLPAHGV